MIRSRGVNGSDAEIVISQIIQSIGGGIASTATQVLGVTWKFCIGGAQLFRLPLRDPSPIRELPWPQQLSCCGRKLAELLEMPSVSANWAFLGWRLTLLTYPAQPVAFGGT